MITVFDAFLLLVFEVSGVCSSIYLDCLAGLRLF